MFFFWQHPATLFPLHPSPYCQSELPFARCVSCFSWTLHSSLLRTFRFEAPSLKEADALNSMRKAKSSIMLVDPMEMEHAMSIKAYASSQGENIIAIPISFLNPNPPTLSHLRIRIDPRWKLDSNQPGLLIMTSGTTGPSKGVIHARRIFTRALQYLTNEDVILCHRSAAWMGGIMSLIAGICRGVQLEIVTRDASVIWERLRTGKITVLRSAPAIWANLMNYYKETISNLTPHVVEQYIRGVQNLHSAITSGGYLLPHVRRFWIDEMNLPMSMTYAGTEMGGPAIYRSLLNFPDEEVRKVGVLYLLCDMH